MGPILQRMRDRATLALTRRALLIQLATLVVQGSCAPLPESTAEWQPHDLLRTFGREQVVAFGRSWLSRSPQSRRRLVSRLRSNGPDVTQQVAADFGRGRVHLIDGWMLSETELLQCALVALHGAAGAP